MESNWAERTIVVSGIPEGILSDTRMIDKLTIHFMRSKNGGGEVEYITYPVDATDMAYVTFEKREVVESVLRQKAQVLEDKRLPVKYPLTISQYSEDSEDVFMQVSVDLDLSMFGERLEFKKLVRDYKSNSKTLRFSNALNGTMHIEGSFSAIKELRKDLTRIAGELLVIDPQSSVSKSGIIASERKLVKPASNEATQMTEPQKLAAPPSYRVNDVLNPDVFEDETTIILDTDIFTYISMFCKEECEAIFRKNYVRAKEIKCDYITVLQLQEASERCQPSQLMTTKTEIQTLISQMQQSLVTEKIRLDGDRGQNKTLNVCKETMQGFPEVWFRITDEYVTLVGNDNHCKQFRKEVEEKVKTVQSVFDPTFSGHSGIPNATGYSHHFGQSLGSSAADRWDVSNATAPSTSTAAPDLAEQPQVETQFVELNLSALDGGTQATRATEADSAENDAMDADLLSLTDTDLSDEQTYITLETVDAFGAQPDLVEGIHEHGSIPVDTEDDVTPCTAEGSVTPTRPSVSTPIAQPASASVLTNAEGAAQVLIASIQSLATLNAAYNQASTKNTDLMQGMASTLVRVEAHMERSATSMCGLEAHMERSATSMCGLEAHMESISRSFAALTPVLTSLAQSMELTLQRTPVGGDVPAAYAEVAAPVAAVEEADEAVGPPQPKVTYKRMGAAGKRR